jgi:hypothetical protein
MIKEILNTKFKLEDGILYKQNKVTKKWRNLNDLPVDKYGHRLVNVTCGYKNKDSRVLRLENILKCFHDEKYDITKIFRKEIYV